MKKYRKKPVVIEAIQFKYDPDNLIEILIEIQEFMQSELKISYENPDAPVIKIETLEGVMDVSIGDWIIKGVNGEFYPCKEEVFLKSYEEMP